jgi:small-conductance mechanosensitive channel
VEVVVPNEQFFTTQVTTFTRSDHLTRINLTLGVSYQSDPKQVREILMETAVKHGLVRKEPPPVVFFNGFGDSSLDFRLAVWIDQPKRAPRVRSDLYFMIWEAFERYNIEIPYPQRDLHLRTGWQQPSED